LSAQPRAPDEPAGAPLHARAVLIDLDGTLLDTVPDLAAAVNAMRTDFGHPPLPHATVAAYVGKGADVLIHRALTDALDGRAEAAVHARARDAFFAHYRRLNGAAARVYDGVPAALDALRERGLRLACVTNKPREFTLALLDRVGLAARFDAIVAGDDTLERKPHPAPLLAACARLGVEPGAAVMVGDSENDLAAARAAGCAVVLVEGGYNEGRPVAGLNADAIVAALAEAARLIVALPQSHPQ
jgi:phosphoglycolate phosphatase